jgi:hypothetical protein|uniref:Uncharacterized protein n=1 Tax=Zea mays TaxID=4577 RepID=A0A804LJX3_MAIZE
MPRDFKTYERGNKERKRERSKNLELSCVHGLDVQTAQKLPCEEKKRYAYSHSCPTIPVPLNRTNCPYTCTQIAKITCVLDGREQTRRPRRWPRPEERRRLCCAWPWRLPRSWRRRRAGRKRNGRDASATA